MPFRDQRRPCAGCGADLADLVAFWRCRHCRSVWIAEDRLREMVIEMQPYDVGGLRFAERSAAVLHQKLCPTCMKPMLQVRFEGVSVERCADGHGVWFDGAELQRALKNAGDREPFASLAGD